MIRSSVYKTSTHLGKGYSNSEFSKSTKYKVNITKFLNVSNTELEIEIFKNTIYMHQKT